MPFADLADVRLFYTDEGTGDPPLLLVHGWTCDSHDWSWQLPAFSDRHRVIAVDNRGHGRSSVPDGGFRPRVFADDLAQLLRRLDTGPVVAVGHSLGGLIASVLAVEHPELVKAVVAVDPAYGVSGDNVALLQEVLGGLRGPAGYEVGIALFEAMDTVHTPAAVRVWHRRRLLGTPMPVIIETLSGIYETDDQIGLQAESEAYLAKRTCPVLAIHADSGHAEWDGSTHIHPASRALGWDGAGHWLHQERPDEFNNLVLDWVASLPEA